MPEPLDADGVINVCRRLQEQPGFEEWDGLTQKRHDLRHRLLPVEIQGVSEVLEERSPAIEEHGQRYVSREEASAIQIQVSSRSTKPEDVKSAQNLENWGYASFYDHTRRRSARSYGAHRRALDQQTFYGCGILALDFNDLLADKLAGMKLDDAAGVRSQLDEAIEGNPFVIESPQLSATFWEPDLSIVCQVGERTVSSLYQEYEDEELRTFLTSDTMEEDRGDWQTTVQVYHLHTKEFIYDVIARERDLPVRARTQTGSYMLQYRPNPAGRPWYVLIPGRLTSESAPHEGFLPLVGALYPLVQKLNVLETLVNSGALQTGRNMYQLVDIGRKPDDFLSIMSRPSEERVNIAFDLSGAPLEEPPAGKKWEPVPVPDQSQLIRAVEMAREEIERMGFPNVLAPDAGQKASAGYDRALQMQAASTILGPALSNVASAWYELLKLQFDIAKEMGIAITLPVHKRAEGEDATVRESITLNPKDLHDYDLLVSFDSAPASQKFTEEESNIRKYTSRLMSKVTLMSKLYDDPVAEERRIQADQMLMLTQQRALQTLQQALDIYAPQALQQAVDAAGMPPPPERPPEGSVVPGVGAPVAPAEQPQNGVPPSAGIAPAAVAQ